MLYWDSHYIEWKRKCFLTNFTGCLTIVGCEHVLLFELPPVWMLNLSIMPLKFVDKSMPWKFDQKIILLKFNFYIRYLDYDLACLCRLNQFFFLSEYRVVACLFAKSSTAYNPFIYFFLSKTFRTDVKKVLSREFWKKQTRAQSWPPH